MVVLCPHRDVLLSPPLAPQCSIQEIQEGKTGKGSNVTSFKEKLFFLISRAERLWKSLAFCTTRTATQTSFSSLLFLPGGGELRTWDFFIVLHYFKMNTLIQISAQFCSFSFLVFFFFVNELLNERTILSIFCLNIFGGGVIIKIYWYMSPCSLQFGLHWVIVICLS